MRIYSTQLRDKDESQRQIKVTDQLNVNVSSREITPEGYLKGVAAITCVGVQEYHCSEFDIPGDFMVGVFRPPETVFHPETSESAKLKPICLTHPSNGVDVTSENNSRLSVGTIGETVEPLDENTLGAHICVTDKGTVEAVTLEGMEEVSLGYDSHIIRQSGNHNGVEYQYSFIGPMIINHLAIEDAGRCGENIKILDKGWTMKKSDAVKAFKVAGMKDAAIAKFLPGKSDDHDVTDAEMKAFRLGDVDMGGLMNTVAAQMAPMLMEKVSKDKGFMSMLAEAMAGAMGTDPATVEADPAMVSDMEVMEDAAAMDPGAGTEDPDPKKATDSAFNGKAMQDAIAKKVQKRVTLLDKARVMINDKEAIAKLDSMSDREIITVALGDSVSKPETLPVPYLMGMLDTLSKERIEARDSRQTINDAQGHDASVAPMGALAIRNLKE